MIIILKSSDNEIFNVLGITLEEYNSAFDFINKILLEKSIKIDTMHLMSHIYNFTKYYMELQGLDYTLKFYYEETNTGGSCSWEDSYIRLNTYFMNSDTYENMMDAIFHEIHHACQYQEFIESKENPNKAVNKTLLLNSIDKILRNTLPNYYNIGSAELVNYPSIAYEADARLLASINLESYIKYLSPELYERLSDKFAKEGIKTKDLLLANKVEAMDALSANDNYTMFGDEKYTLYLNRDMVLDRLIIASPELLNDYPILNYIYNKDGKRKTIVELVQTIDDNKENKQVVDMLNFWIETSKYSLSSLIRELFYSNYSSLSDMDGYEQIIMTLRTTKFQETMLLESNYFLNKNFVDRIENEINKLKIENPDKTEKLDKFKENIINMYKKLPTTIKVDELNIKVILKFISFNYNNNEFLKNIIEKCNYNTYARVFNFICENINSIPSFRVENILYLLLENSKHLTKYIKDHVDDVKKLCTRLRIDINTTAIPQYYQEANSIKI